MSGASRARPKTGVRQPNRVNDRAQDLGLFHLFILFIRAANKNLYGAGFTSSFNNTQVDGRQLQIANRRATQGDRRSESATSHREVSAFLPSRRFLRCEESLEMRPQWSGRLSQRVLIVLHKLLDPLGREFVCDVKALPRLA